MSFFRTCFLFFALLYLPLSGVGEEKGALKPKGKTQVKKVVRKKVNTPPYPVKKSGPVAKKKEPFLKDQQNVKKVTPANALPIIEAPKLQTLQALPKPSSQVNKNSPNQLRLIVLDPGHGGYDIGARMSACDEKSLALSTALLTKKHLIDMGYRVIMTRSRDVFMTLEKRVLIANETKSKLFVSIHFNAAKNLTAKGIEVFFCGSQDKIRSDSSKKLASCVLNKMIDKTHAENRGVKDGKFFVIRETKMPAILVEAGFMTHLDELHLLKDIQYRDKLAKGIAEGIDQFFK